MNEVFAPEKVRELSKRMVDQLHIGHTPFFILSEWLEQNPIEPVVVGLSDEQVDKFERSLSYKSGGFVVLLRDFLRTQTFAQTRAFDDSELSEKYMTLYDDYQSLLIDLSLQRVEPDWDDAPTEAYSTRVIQNFYNKTGVPMEGVTKILLEEHRPKPTPKVEVGQVWNDKEDGDKVNVIFVSEQTVGFTFIHGDECFCKIPDFITKFEMVS